MGVETPLCLAVIQLVEYLAVNQRVASSILAREIIIIRIRRIVILITFLTT